MQISQEEQLGSETNHTTQGSSAGKESLKTSGCKNPMGIETLGETPSLICKSVEEVHGILEYTQAHPPGNQNLKWHNLLVGSKESDGKWGES